MHCQTSRRERVTVANLIPVSSGGMKFAKLRLTERWRETRAQVRVSHAPSAAIDVTPVDASPAAARSLHKVSDPVPTESGGGEKLRVVQYNILAEAYVEKDSSVCRYRVSAQRVLHT